MTSIDEKRVYGETTEATELLVAAAVGVGVVEVSGDIVGEFRLDHRCVARDVAVAAGRPVVATAEDVLVGGAFESTGFGPAVAVTGHDGAALAAAEDGRVARLVDGEWRPVGAVDGTIRALDGALVAADDGVHRVDDVPRVEDAPHDATPRDGGLTRAGLDEAADVSEPGVPLAATADGLYRLGNGWLAVADGEFRAVSADPASEPGSLARAHATTGDALYAHRAGERSDGEYSGGERGTDDRDDGEWTPVALPTDEPVVDVAYAGGAYAVTAAGTVLVDAGDGWRGRATGFRDAAALAVP